MQEVTNRSNRLIGLLLLAATAGLYLRTQAPGLLDGDAGEFQFAAWRLGLAHPTGYPLYLLLGSLWQHTLAGLGVNPAGALNSFSALTGAAAVALLYQLMRSWLPGARQTASGVALFTALFFAVNPTFWSQNLIAEVYALHTLFLLLILWAAQGLLLKQGSTASAAAQPRSPNRLLALAFLVGLALTHHAMTLWLLPGLLLALSWWDRQWWRRRQLLLTIGVVALPGLLYLYIPLRSGPLASPWYHQRLGDSVLTLYDNTPAAFLNFITGRSIAVGFYDWAEAWANVSQAGLLWRLHLTWLGLALAGWGLYSLCRGRHWPILALTLPYFLFQQIFNLFYAIGDILVYYIPLYLLATIWAGFGLQALLTRSYPPQVAEAAEPAAVTPTPRSSLNLSFLLLILCFLLPLSLLRDYYPRLDQSTAQGARSQWEAILAAPPPPDAILISNDRNEIVPLFYLQAVEGRGLGLTGLFPLIKPDQRFADVGAAVATALAAQQQPVYLIKAMPGLEVKFTLEPAPPPLVRVSGLAASVAPQRPLDLPFGPLHLLGYDWQPVGEQVEIRLHWAVRARLPGNYTTTVQLFDRADAKLAQDDRPAGGVYYPTALWKVGETLLDRHLLPLPAGQPAATLLIDLYDPTGQGSDWGEPLRIPLPKAVPKK